MRFLRDLAHRWWKQMVSAAILSQLPRLCRWVAEEWVGSHIVDLIDGLVRKVHLWSVVGKLWSWMSFHPILSAMGSTCFLLMVLSLETKVHEVRHRELAGADGNASGLQDSLPPTAAMANGDQTLRVSTPPPLRIDLLIENDGSQWTWRIHNRGLQPIFPVVGNLHIRGVQSFDTALGMPRESGRFDLLMDKIKTVEAGDLTKKFVFARIEEGDLEIGERKHTRLPWPDGDPSELREWIMTLWAEILPGAKIWQIGLTLRWNTKNKVLTFGAYTSELLQD